MMDGSMSGIGVRHERLHLRFHILELRKLELMALHFLLFV
jgi:hypothetical protein